MTDAVRDLFHQTADLAADFLEGLPERPVRPQAEPEDLLAALGGPVPEEPTEPRSVVSELASALAPGLMASAGGRFFGFVIGGAVPASVAADWLTSAWDQNAGLVVAAPGALAAEQVAGTWLLELLGLPASASFGFVTSGQTANFTALAAARQHVLAHAGWDVNARGLNGAPPIRVVVGANRHGTIDRALRFLGLGAPTEVVPADDQGRMRVDLLDLGDEPTIVCAQAGEVNTGAFDDFHAAADRRDAAANTWLHVDGAFGLWAAAAPGLAHLLDGCARADSWSTDAHKWLNVPYDCGIAFTAHPESHAFSIRAAYLQATEQVREPLDFVPEHSRRARALPVYAAIRALGRSGIAELVSRCCAHARAIASGLDELGAHVLNDVVLNQVLFRFESDEETRRVLAGVQASGEAWMSGTTWDERAAIRISVSNWQTDAGDVARTLAAYAGQRAAR